MRRQAASSERFAHHARDLLDVEGQDDKGTASVRAQVVAAVRRLSAADLDFVAQLVERLGRRDSF